jgi:small subunit ribosomal protein S16
VVAIDSRSRRDGSAIEELGWFDPIAPDKEKNFVLKEDRILYWLKEGAQTTEIAHRLIKRAGIAYKWHLMKQGLEEDAIEKEMQKWALNQEKIKKTRAVKSAGKKKKTEKEELKPTEAEGDKISEVAVADKVESESTIDVEPDAKIVTDEELKEITKPAETTEVAEIVDEQKEEKAEGIEKEVVKDTDKTDEAEKDKPGSEIKAKVKKEKVEVKKPSKVKKTAATDKKPSKNKSKKTTTKKSTVKAKTTRTAAKSKESKQISDDSKPVIKKSAGTAKGTKKSSVKSKKDSTPKTDDKSEEKS